jgi:hypothetical protein
MSASYALDAVTHDDEQSWPFFFRELAHGCQDTLMNLQAIRLTETYNKNPEMRLVPVANESFVGRYEHSLFVLHAPPKNVVGRPFVRCAADIDNVVTQGAQVPRSPGGHVLVHEDLHGDRPVDYSGVTCSSAREAA